MNMSNFKFNLDPAKYKSVVLALLEIGGGKINGKKKMAKLLYFFEFDFFEKYQEQSTGETFKKYQMGPYPVNAWEIINELVESGDMEIKTEKNFGGYEPTETYLLSSNYQSSNSLNNQELDILERIKDLYINKSGKELEDISHLEAPWNAVDMYQVMNPHLANYRCTEF